MDLYSTQCVTCLKCVARNSKGIGLLLLASWVPSPFAFIIFWYNWMSSQTQQYFIFDEQHLHVLIKWLTASLITLLKWRFRPGVRVNRNPDFRTWKRQHLGIAVTVLFSGQTACLLPNKQCQKTEGFNIQQVCNKLINPNSKYPMSFKFGDQNYWNSTWQITSIAIINAQHVKCRVYFITSYFILLRVSLHKEPSIHGKLLTVDDEC